MIFLFFTIVQIPNDRQVAIGYVVGSSLWKGKLATFALSSLFTAEVFFNRARKHTTDQHIKLLLGCTVCNLTRMKQYAAAKDHHHTANLIWRKFYEVQVMHVSISVHTFSLCKILLQSKKCSLIRQFVNNHPDFGQLVNYSCDESQAIVHHALCLTMQI